MMVRRLSVVALAALLLGAGAAARAGAVDDTLVWAGETGLDGVDPYHAEGVHAQAIAAAVWDGLVLRNPATGDYDPLLARAYRWVDPTTLEFELRRDVRFHDGSRFDADDVVYTVAFVTDPANTVTPKRAVAWMKRAVKLDVDRVRIELVRPYPAALAQLSRSVKMLRSGHYDGAAGSDARRTAAPIGTGPYRVRELIGGRRVVMTRYHGYHTEGPKGDPPIRRLVYRTLASPELRLAELLTGGVDWLADLPATTLDRLRPLPGLLVGQAPSLRFSYLQFDVNGGSGVEAFRSHAVRRAVAHAIDRTALARSLAGPGARALDVPCHPVQIGCPDDAPHWHHDPTLARTLLAEAGFADGFAFDLYSYRDHAHARALAAELAGVGIEARVQALSYPELRDRLWRNELPAAHMSWDSFGLADAFAVAEPFFSGGGADLARDEAVNEAVAAARETFDPAARAALYAAAFARIAAEIYWLPLFTYTQSYVMARELDFRPDVDGIPRFHRARWR